MAQELTFNISEDRRQLQGPVEAKNFNLKFGTDGSAITHGKPDQWVQGRIGDDQLKQVFVNITEGENNTPKDVAGMFLAFVGIIHDKDGRPHRVVDYKHSTTIDVEHGRFRFDFPDQAFTVAGEYQQAFFMLIKEGPGGGCVATMEFDMQVMANFVFTDLVPEDYITPFNDTVDQLLAACKKFKDDTAADEAKFKQELDDAYAKFQNDTNTQFSNFKDATDDDLAKFKKANADDIANFKQQYADAVKAKQDELQKIVDNYTDKIDTMLKDLNQQGIDTSTMLTNLRSQMAALQDKIEQEHLFTEDEAKAFENQMTNLINSLLSTVTKTVKTNAELKKTDLNKGESVKTLGEFEVGDGGAATYLITDAPSDIKLDNGLYAEKIYSGKDNYYDEIKETTKRINNTDVYFVDIPKTDSHGQPITPYIAQNGADRYYNAATKEGGYHDSPTGRDETPTEYARSEHTTLTVNGSASVMVANNTYVNGNIIGNGKILNTWQDQPASVVVPSNFVYVGIMKDRSLREFPFSTTAQQMLDAGVQNSWMSYWRLIRDGNLVDNSNSKGNEGHTKVKDLNPHLGLGIKEDGTLVIAACDGRTDVNSGLTSDDFAQAMKDWGCVNAWHMDGGGSTSVTLRGSKINRNIDDYGVTDRAIPYTFNIKKPGSDTGIAEAFSQAGKAQQETLRQVMPTVHHLDTTTAKWFGQYSFKSDDELDQWLNDSLPDLINWIDYPAGGITSGVIATQYQNSAPGKTVDIVNNADWLATFFVSGSHNWGYLTLTTQWGSGMRTVVRSFGKPLNPQWGNWMPENYPVQITPTKIDPQISICNVFRSGTQVSVDIKMTISGTSHKWIAMIEGLPHPVAASQPFRLESDNASTARAVIDQGGWIDVKGEAGTYYGHFVYLANNY